MSESMTRPRLADLLGEPGSQVTGAAGDIERALARHAGP